LSVLTGGRLGSMNSRVLLLVGAMLVSPAWSQEPAFDLKSDSIKKIVRDTAATQFATIQVPSEKPVAPKQVAEIKFVPSVAAPPVKYPTRLPEPATPAAGLFYTLVDAFLDVGDDSSLEFRYPLWLSCQARDDLKHATQQDPCPSASPKDLRHPSGL